MGEKDNNIIEVDKIVQNDYPFIGTIGTYLNFELKEMSNAELEVEIMKKKEQTETKENKE